MIYSALIVDDERNGRENLKNYLVNMALSGYIKPIW